MDERSHVVNEENFTLKAENVSKSFGKKQVLSSCSIEIKSGKITGILGPNGCGKTTFMKIALGLLLKDSGSFSCGSSAYIPTDFSFGIVETPIFCKYISGYDNLNILCDFFRDDDKRIYEVSEELGLSKEELSKKVSAYSLGMKQKLALIMALCSPRPILILDEPTNGLDVVACEKFNRLLKEKAAKENTSVLISSHNMDEIQKVCDNIYFLTNGKFTADRETLKKIRLLSYRLVFKNEKACSDAAKILPNAEHEPGNDYLTVNLSFAEDITDVIGAVWKYGLTEAKKAEKNFSELYSYHLSHTAEGGGKNEI